MPLTIIILLDCAVIYFFFGNQISRWLRTPEGRMRYRLKEFEKQLNSVLLRNRDIMPEDQVQALQDAIAELAQARKRGTLDQVKHCLGKYSREDIKGLPKAPKGMGGWIREHLEVLVVALGVAFGIRSLFIQPFKIPTGSMQPTLYGIHFVSSKEAPSMNPLTRFFSYWNKSRSAVDLVVKQDGRLDWSSLRVSPGSKPFLPESEFRIGDVWYQFPGTVEQTQAMIDAYQTEKAERGPILVRSGAPLIRYRDYDGIFREEYVEAAGMLDWTTMKTVRDDRGRPITTLTICDRRYQFDLPGEDVKKMIIRYHLHPLGDGYAFQKGDVVIRGYAETGDHLFVNRLGLMFREPRRGDPMVFMTAGLVSQDGRPFGGSYYVKRLVGLPGDTLRIRDRKLYVKPKGETEFRLLDGKDHPGFEKMYSMKGAYRGYAHMRPNPQLGSTMGGAAFLHSNEETFTVPEGEYFMMGDNSENSWDSRWFGSVPRRNLVGPPGFVWWPFSRRWGIPDRCEPDPEIGDTPATMPVVERTYEEI